MSNSNAVLKDEQNQAAMKQEKIESKEELLQALSGLDHQVAAQLLAKLEPSLSASALRTIDPEIAVNISSKLSADARELIEQQLPSEVRTQWKRNANFPEGSIGRMMEPAWAVFPPEMTAAEAIEVLRDIVKREFITYGYVINQQQQLVGVLVMRDLLFAEPTQRLEEIMLTNPFSLKADTALMDGMKEVLVKHYPVYPVTNQNNELMGVVRGHTLFEAQAIEISAQAGSMVGVEKEEKLTTPWTRSFKYRHPWLQLNLLTAFVAGAVVSIFQGTIDQLVILASFLPVLAGQSGNTGSQALAVTIRGMTLRELKDGSTNKLLMKEGLLGLLNGTFVGISAGIGMYVLAVSQDNPMALALSIIVFVSMIGSCIVSGIFGAIVPLTLRKLGADPATASSIFLTTATDVVSMGLMLSLATWFLL